MIENARLVEILQPFGSFEQVASQMGRSVRSGPILQAGVWTIPIDDEQCLRVEESALPLAVAQLLALYVQAQETGGKAHASNPKRLVQDMLSQWLNEGRLPDQDALVHALMEMKWRAHGAVFVVLERVNAQGDDAKLLEDAVALLVELLDENHAFVVRQGQSRICLLLHSLGNEEQVAEEEQPENELSAWLDTLGTELYLLFRAGVSTPVSHLRDLAQVRQEAEFALEAGKRFRSQEMVHSYARLGVARLLHGIPLDVRDEFLKEVLPEEALSSLSPELRETIFAFLEHGQQVADTARSLFVHRNTLLYRLDRIHELTGFDIRRPTQGWTLWVALTLIRSR